MVQDGPYHILACLIFVLQLSNTEGCTPAIKKMKLSASKVQKRFYVSLMVPENIC